MCCDGCMTPTVPKGPEHPVHPDDTIPVISKAMPTHTVILAAKRVGIRQGSEFPIFLKF